MSRLERARVMRTFAVVLAAVAALAVAIAVGRGLVFSVGAGLFAILGAMVTIRLSTLTIRLERAKLRPRPDYALIARMEREVFGEAFEHAGAPPAIVSHGTTGHTSNVRCSKCPRKPAGTVSASYYYHG